MKNLVKLLVLVGAFAMTTELCAQNFGVRAGLNVSNMLLKDNDETYSDEFNWRTGFHIGASAEFPLSEIFSFETGLLLSTKGYSVLEEDEIFGIPFSAKSSLNLYYLDIPLTAKASFDLGGVRVYGLLGPYIGLGLSGKAKFEVAFGSDKETGEEEITWGADEDLKRLDYGLAVGAGVEIQSILIGVTYNLGLANISTENDNGLRANNRVLAVSVGYVFGK